MAAVNTDRQRTPESPSDPDSEDRSDEGTSRRCGTCTEPRCRKDTRSTRPNPSPRSRRSRARPNFELEASPSSSSPSSSKFSACPHNPSTYSSKQTNNATTMRRRGRTWRFHILGVAQAPVTSVPSTPRHRLPYFRPSARFWAPLSSKIAPRRRGRRRRQTRGVG